MAEVSRIDLAGRSVPVRLRRNAQARRFILRLDKRGDGVVVTLPGSARDADALDFVRRHADWIGQRLGDTGPTAFRPGARVPLRGVEHVIVHDDTPRGRIRATDVDGRAVLRVCGGEAHLARRLTDWFKREARRDFEERVAVHTAALGVRAGKISVRDQTSRWGSCSARGALSFSWRLVLAPPDILDYVCAHEVAHLREMNHGPRFWAHVRDICPHMEASMAWLKAEGAGLHRFGG